MAGKLHSVLHWRTPKCFPLVWKRVPDLQGCSCSVLQLILWDDPRFSSVARPFVEKHPTAASWTPSLGNPSGCPGMRAGHDFSIHQPLELSLGPTVFLMCKSWHTASSCACCSISWKVNWRGWAERVGFSLKSIGPTGSKQGLAVKSNFYKLKNAPTLDGWASYSFYSYRTPWLLLLFILSWWREAKKKLSDVSKAMQGRSSEGIWALDIV